MTTSTILVVTIAVAAFASFAVTLSWAPQHARHVSTMPARVIRPKRRPF